MASASFLKEEDRVLQPLHLQGAPAGPSGDRNVEAGNDCDERLRARHPRPHRQRGQQHREVQRTVDDGRESLTVSLHVGVPRRTVHVRRDRDQQSAQQMDEVLENKYRDVAVWKWDQSMVRQWLVDEELIGLSEMTDSISNGRRLISFHRDFVRRHYGKRICSMLEEAGFFKKLLSLKINSRKFLTVILDSYVDDFMIFLPPDEKVAIRTCDDLSKFLKNNGVQEKLSKKEQPNVTMDLLEREFDSVKMTITIPKIKIWKMKQMLLRGLILGFVSLKEYG